MSLPVRREKLEKRPAGWVQRSGEGGVQYPALFPEGVLRACTALRFSPQLPQSFPVVFSAAPVW